MALIDLGMSWEDAEKASEFPLIDPGIYSFRVKEFEETKTKEKGDPMIVFKLELFNMPNPDWNVPLNYYCPLSSTAFLVRLMKGVGFRFEGTGFDPAALVGREGKLEIIQDVYEEKPQSKIKRIIC